MVTRRKSGHRLYSFCQISTALTRFSLIEERPQGEALTRDLFWLAYEHPDRFDALIGGHTGWAAQLNRIRGELDGVEHEQEIGPPCPILPFPVSPGMAAKKPAKPRGRRPKA